MPSDHNDRLAARMGAEWVARPEPTTPAGDELTAGKDELLRLMQSIWKSEYRNEAPDWQPLPDLVGMVTQIDNMYAGVRQQRDQARHDVAAAHAAGRAAERAEVAAWLLDWADNRIDQNTFSEARAVLIKAAYAIKRGRALERGEGWWTLEA